MLTCLSIRNFVLIDTLEIAFDGGLNTLTGETGAGKSILLDSLSLALGGRADASYVRHGCEKAQISANFDLSSDHPVFALLTEQDIPIEDTVVVLRRVVGADGRSRAFINDCAVSAALLRRAGELLVEIQGQFEQHGLLNSKIHRTLLDSFAGLTDDARQVFNCWTDWKKNEAQLLEKQALLAKDREEDAYLRHNVAELEALAAQSGEEDRLSEKRDFLLNREKLKASLSAALWELEGSAQAKGAEACLAAALKHLEKVSEKAAGTLDKVVQGLDGLTAELAEMRSQLLSISYDLDQSDENLEALEERYFALKDAARKHSVSVNDLPTMLENLRDRLQDIDAGQGSMEALSKKVEASKTIYFTQAQALSSARMRAAEYLDTAINAELMPLKLEKARFQTAITRLGDDEASRDGLDSVTFTIAANPGVAPGPLSKVASGGELSRLLLALKLVLAEHSPAPVLIFDEVDSGVGGATAAAIGERLAMVAKKRQVLVVTHSPQVAAKATHHWIVAKTEKKNVIVTSVERLSDIKRREEIARMLSGERITEEARKAAETLLGLVL